MYSIRTTIWLRFLLLMATVATIVVSAICLQRHREWRSMEDLAMFDQMLWNAREGRDLTVSVSGDLAFQKPHHFFSEHLSPILYLFAWPAGLTDGPEALLVLQVMIFMLAAIPLFLWLKKMMGNESLACLIAIVWLLSPSLWLALAYDFHMEAAEGLFLFGCLWAIWERRPVVWLWAVLYCACKEDAPAYLAALGFSLIFFRDFRRIGLQLFLLGGVWFVAALFLVIPAFSIKANYAMGGRLMTPGQTGGWESWFLAVFANIDRWKTIAIHLFQLGLLPLAAGVMFIPFMAAMGIPWLSRDADHALLSFHYALVVYPWFFVALGFGVYHIMNMKPHRWLRRWRPALVSTMIIGGSVFAWYRVGEQVDLPAAYYLTQPNATSKRMEEIKRLIPEETSLTTNPNFAPHLARRENLHLTMHPLYKSEWILTPLSCRDMPMFRRASCEDWMGVELMRPTSGYRLFATDGSDFMLLRAGEPTAAIELAIQRGMHQARAINLYHKTGKPVRDVDTYSGTAWHVSEICKRGPAIFGPYVTLEPGSYVARFRLRTSGPGMIGKLRVTEDRGKIILAEVPLPGNIGKYQEIEIPFTSKGRGNMEVVCDVTAPGQVWLDYVKWYNEAPGDFQAVLLDSKVIQPTF